MLTNVHLAKTERPVFALVRSWNLRLLKMSLHILLRVRLLTKHMRATFMLLDHFLDVVIVVENDTSNLREG